MLQYPLLRRWLSVKPYQLTLTVILLIASLIVTIDSSAVAKKSQKVQPTTSQRFQKAIAVPKNASGSPESAQIDPLNSPHPIPWNWIMETQAQVSSSQGSGVRFYRTPSLVSPDGKYAAYSRIQIQVQKEMYRSRVSSVMFVEDLSTGRLRVVNATSPLANNPLKRNEPGDQPGVISVLVPVSWSSNGDRLLGRQFEGFFNTSDASDYAVVWDRQENRARTIAPGKIQYSNAVLLGWSQLKSDQVIFRAGELGDETAPLWAVNFGGRTVAATKKDQPIVFGNQVKNSWAGPQAHW